MCSRKVWLIIGVLWFFGLPGLRAITWRWSNPLPHGNDVVDMAYHNGVTVQVGDAGQLYTSDDLNLWLSPNTHTSNDLQSVTYLGNRLIAVGANGAVVYSDDNVNFAYTNLATPNSDWLVSVTASTNLAVAVGDQAIIYTSKDGAGWKQQASPPSVGGNWLRGVTYGNGLFVTVGEGGYIASSVDGTNWTKRAAPLTDDLNWVEWIYTPASTNGFANPSFIAVSDTGKAITSTNGTNWSALVNQLQSGTTNSLFAVTGNDNTRVFAGDNSLFLEAVVSNHTVFPSELGMLPGTAPAWVYYCGVVESNEYLVAGQAGLCVEGNLSTNGNSYTWSTLDESSRSWMWQVTCVTNLNLYVAVGNQARIMTSGDGAAWAIEAVPNTNSVSPTNTVFFGVGGSSNQLIAVGSGGTVVLSTNVLTAVVVTNANDGSVVTNQVSTMGVVWSPVPPPTTNDLDGVAYFGGQYYLSGGNGTILRSPTGLSWSQVSTPTTHYLSSLEVYAGGLVAVGDVGTILTSPDGTTWTQQSSGTTNWIFHVRNVGGKLIGVGENGTILSSANGTSWSAQASGTTAWLNDVTMVSNTFYIVGNQGTVLTSPNASTWTSIGTITSSSLYGAATQDGQLVAVGISGAILRSQIVPFTSPVEIQTYAQADGQNLFFVAGTTNQQGFVAINQQFTVDSSTNLVNWTTGPLLETDSSGTLLFYLGAATNSSSQYYRTHLVLPQ